MGEVVSGPAGEGRRPRRAVDRDGIVPGAPVRGRRGATAAPGASPGTAAWQEASGHASRARAEAAIPRFERGIGDGLRSRTGGGRATEADVAVHALERVLGPGRPPYVRVA